MPTALRFTETLPQKVHVYLNFPPVQFVYLGPVCSSSVVEEIGELYFACWVIYIHHPQSAYSPSWSLQGVINHTSIFFTCFRNEAPYLVPYFPVTPTFFVRFVIVADVL